MTATDIREEIIDILTDIVPDEDLSNLEDDKPLREQIELDSMDFLDIVMELRKRYRIQIPEDDYINLATLAGTVKYLEPLMRDLQRASGLRPLPPRLASPRAADMYDVVIIGAGMSGLAAGIRLAMFDRRVCILERHYAVGGLNSYYRLDGRNYDVGLHALTNFAPRTAKQGPLPRLLRQLRLSWDDFELAEQSGSVIAFPDVSFDSITILPCWPRKSSIRFRPNATSIARLLSNLVELRRAAIAAIGSFGARNPRRHLPRSAIDRDAVLPGDVLRQRARARSRLGIVLRSVSQPFSWKACAAARRHSSDPKTLGPTLQATAAASCACAGVSEIDPDGEQVLSIVLDDGSELRTRQVISSAGWNETMRLCAARQPALAAVAATDRAIDATASSASSVPEHTGQSGKMTFIESICTLDCQPRELDFDRHHRVLQRSRRNSIMLSRTIWPMCPAASSARRIITATMTFRTVMKTIKNRSSPPKALLRLTALANFDRWAPARTGRNIKIKKARWLRQMVAAADRFIPHLAQHIVATTCSRPPPCGTSPGTTTGRCTARRKNGTMQRRTWKTCGFAAPTRGMSASSAR